VSGTLVPQEPPERAQDPYEEALDEMLPLESAAHRTADVFGCLGVIVGLGAGGAAAIAAWKLFGISGGWKMFAAIAAGSTVPFLFVGLTALNRRRAIRAAEADRQRRLTVGTHAALTAKHGDEP
jgi:hypothetical protein